MTEDEVRNQAEKTLGFDDGEQYVKQGTGQITTFNRLGFFGEKNKPDGWYLPYDTNRTAIITEFKDSAIKIDKKAILKELSDNVAIVMKKYSNVIGILWNGKDIIITLNNERLYGTFSGLQNKKYYLNNL